MRGKGNMAKVASLVLALAFALAVVGCTKEKKEAPPAPPEKPAPAKVKTPDAPAQPASPTPPATDQSKVNLDKLRYVMVTETPEEGELRLEFMVDKPRLKMRVSGTQDGAEAMMNVIVDGKAIYMVQEEAKMVVKMPLTDDALADLMPVQEDFTFSFADYKKEAGNGKIEEKGTADFHGQTVKVYEVEEPMTKAKVQLYVDDKDLVRSIEYTDPATNETTLTEIIEIDTDPKFADDEFKVPEGYTVQDMSGMMQPPP